MARWHFLAREEPFPLKNRTTLEEKCREGEKISGTSFLITASRSKLTAFGGQLGLSRWSHDGEPGVWREIL